MKELFKIKALIVGGFFTYASINLPDVGARALALSQVVLISGLIGYKIRGKEE